ncbi:hypothetical protein MSAN_01413200 [Mycena sanguinolenta]|uniref:Protein kinase domain-containing protein n=1 Tax=Mycena sanguinolenta TaxID=230812 RepID=A0A8H6Y9A5_9AGAR|nr:hypothetical protein MSAN_01413200 [Mycena sanguinolenta]
MATSGTHALSLQEATRNSTAAWQRDLATLFQNAKDRFPDVMWELSSEPEEGGNSSGGSEVVWGAQGCVAAIVYARAPPSFETRYFSLQPSDGLGASTMSLDIPRTSPSPSPLGPASPAPSTIGGITRLATSNNPALLSNELEYLTSLDGEELRIDKLRKDLFYMWRSRLYSDVRVALAMNGPAAPAGRRRRRARAADTRLLITPLHPRLAFAPLSSSLSSSLLTSTYEPLTLSLPSPPFTPASMHFTLGFLYTGILAFSHRTYDLSTALALLLSSNYLQLPTLYAEVQARIISEMAHGLFHAAFPFAAYEELTKGVWRAGGCTCRKCASRVPRILEYSRRPDVQDPVLERGTRRALVGLFGTGWCTSEFAALPAKLQASALKGLAKRTTPANALRILWAAEAALARLSPMVDPWVDVVRPLIESGRTQVDSVLGNQTAEVFGEADWTQLMHTADERSEDGERVNWAMRGVVRGLKESNAGRVYQVPSSTSSSSHTPTRPRAGAAPNEFSPQPLPSQTSYVRMQVEQARMDTLTWLKRGGPDRVDRVAREGGFDGVEAWAVREIADYPSGLLDDIHRGPWFEIHRNLISYVLHTVESCDGPSNEIIQLSKQWAEWDGLTSLANYRSVVQILLGYLTKSSNLNHDSAINLSNRLSADVSCVLQQMNSILSNRTTYKHFLTCRGAAAQRLLDLLQELLDSPHEPSAPFARALFSKALLRLSGECELHPTCFTLTGLEKLGQQVAGGGFGDIWKGLVGGQIVAVKSMRQFADDDVKIMAKKLGREALIWRQLSHPNLLPFFGLYMLDNRLCLISPWMENGHLKHFLSTAPHHIGRASLVADVAMGLEYLHSKNVVHGDLKTLNILVTPSGRACITDFGLSTIIDELSLELTFSSRSGRAGTVRYQAPELLKNESPNHYGSDVYAFACVSYEILTGKAPYFELTNDAAIILKVVYEEVRPSRLEVISPDFWLLLEDCWHQQIDKRPSTTAISRRLSKRSIGREIIGSLPDWNDTYSARFRRSVQEWPVLPSVDEIERRILSKTTTVDVSALLVPPLDVHEDQAETTIPPDEEIPWIPDENH